MAGFLTGWMYWYFWVIVVALEAVAGAKLIQFWLPDTPAWIISLALLVVLTLTNLISVGSYGEFEFWFSSIKVGAIMVFLFLGGLYVLGLRPASMHTTSVLPTLLGHGGFMPLGIGPVMSGRSRRPASTSVLKSSRSRQPRRRNRRKRLRRPPPGDHARAGVLRRLGRASSSRWCRGTRIRWPRRT